MLSLTVFRRSDCLGRARNGRSSCSLLAVVQDLEMTAIRLEVISIVSVADFAGEGILSRIWRTVKSENH